MGIGGATIIAPRVPRVTPRIGAVTGVVTTTLEETERHHRACVLCVEAGLLERAHPVFGPVPGARVMLVGQAPGVVEDDVSRPFAGRAGRQLMRWLARAGIPSEAEVRRRVFMTSMTTCFPGRRPGDRGDRRPSGREVRLCGDWLDAYLRLLRPELIICVGTLSQARFLPGRRLDELVGEAWTASGEVVGGTPAGRPVLVPLPHPSGQSRWLNDPARMDRLDDWAERPRG